MPIQVMPNNFLVKINKEKQSYFKQHVNINSPIYVPPTNVHESKNMEHGIIIQAGKKASAVYNDNFKLGFILIFHWRIEANDSKTGEQFFVMEDETWNYYIVPVSYTRGIWNGNKVLPHPDYIFLKNVQALPTQGEFDEMYKSYLEKTDSGIFKFSKWEDSAVMIAHKIEELKKRINSLIKGKRTPDVQNKIAEIERERQELNRKAQKPCYLPYKVAYANPSLNERFGVDLINDDIVYAWNLGCKYLTNFQDNPDYQYIIASVEYIAFLYRKVSKSITEKQLATEYA